jgi:hypothetical protein
VTYSDVSPDGHPVTAATGLRAGGVIGSADVAFTVVNLDLQGLEGVTTAAVDTVLDTEVGKRSSRSSRGATEGSASLLGDGIRG